MLADETLIFPGHECDGRSVSSIAEERNHNPYFSGQSRDAFATSVSQLQSTVARTSATKH
jgi:hypothetical protein